MTLYFVIAQFAFLCANIVVCSACNEHNKREEIRCVEYVCVQNDYDYNECACDENSLYLP